MRPLYIIPVLFILFSCMTGAPVDTIVFYDPLEKFEKAGFSVKKVSDDYNSGEITTNKLGSMTYTEDGSFPYDYMPEWHKVRPDNPFFWWFSNVILYEKGSSNEVTNIAFDGYYSCIRENNGRLYIGARAESNDFGFFLLDDDGNHVTNIVPENTLLIIDSSLQITTNYIPTNISFGDGWNFSMSDDQSEFIIAFSKGGRYALISYWVRREGEYRGVDWIFEDNAYVIYDIENNIIVTNLCSMDGIDYMKLVATNIDEALDYATDNDNFGWFDFYCLTLIDGNPNAGYYTREDDKWRGDVGDMRRLNFIVFSDDLKEVYVVACEEYKDESYDLPSGGDKQISTGPRKGEEVWGKIWAIDISSLRLSE